MTTTSDPHDPFGRVSGLPPSKYRAWNRQQPCSVPGCADLRDTGSLCRRHYRRLCAYGHLTKRHIDSNEIWKAKQRARKLLDASLEAGHPLALAGVEGVKRLLSPGSFIHAEAKHDFLRRISATADPRAVIVETTAVCLCLYERDPDGYADPEYLATQITHRIRKLGPRRYANASGEKSIRRSKACAGAIFDTVGPLVTLMVQTLMRNRRIRQSRSKPKQPNEGTAA